VPLLRGEKLPPVSSYAETSLGGYRTRSGEEVFRVRCILDGTWKLVESLLPGGRRVELYNLDRDAAERYNFASRYPGEAKRLSDLLQKVYQDSHVLWKPPRELPQTVWKGPPPSLKSPANGARFSFDSAHGRIRFVIDGPDDFDYEVQYSVGEGAQLLEGVFYIHGRSPQFGPFPHKTWDALRQWNPWKLRLRPRGTGDRWSPWYTFYVD